MELIREKMWPGAPVERAILGGVRLDEFAGTFL